MASIRRAIQGRLGKGKATKDIAMTKGKPTIRDIADMTGYSVGTVCRVCHGAGNVTPEVRRAVMEAIAATGYPAPRRRAAPVKSAKRICVVATGMGAAWQENSTWARLLAGIESACSAAGVKYDVLYNAPGDTPESVAAAASAYDGALIKSSASFPRLAGLLPKGFPLACFLGTHPEVACPQAEPDDTGAGRLAAGHLLRRGHRRVAYVNPLASNPAFSLRRLGVAEALTAAGAYLPELMLETGRESDGREPEAAPPDMAPALRRLLAMPCRPTAVIVGNDWAAAGFYRACAANGVAIPGDLSVVGFDNIGAVCDLLSPGLTTVDMNFPALAAVAANDLLALLAGQPLPHAPCARYVGGTIVERGSVRDLG